MEFKEFLTSKGVTEEQATSIVSDMSKNKFYLSKEDKLDERYSKAKGQKEQLEEDLKKANETINSLQASNQSNTDLQAQIDDYKNQIEKISNQRAEDQKNSAIDLALTKANAKNVQAVKALLKSDDLKFGENGLEGLDKQLESLKESDGYLFTENPKDQKKSVFIEGNPSGSQVEDELGLTQRIAQRMSQI